MDPDMEEYLLEDVEYDLEYSEDSNSEGDVQLENQYYLAKSIKENESANALNEFKRVMELQGENKCEWGFKALKQLVKLNFNMKNYKATVEYYKELLTYLTRIVTKNYGEKSINSILEYISSSNDSDLLQTFYEATLDHLKTSKNERLWFKTNTKLARVYLERADYQKFSQIISLLKKCYQPTYPVDQQEETDPYYDNQLLEVYSLEIQLYTARKNNKQLQILYEACQRVRSAVPHPLIMSIIKECGGKMYLRMGLYEKAYTDFYEAFKNYDESGNPRRITCLKYLTLTSMLMQSMINLFDSPETNQYRNHPEVKALTDLIQAFQTNDSRAFEQIYQANKVSLMSDDFIREHIADLLRCVRCKVVVNLVKPYRNIKWDYIAKELNIDGEEVQDLLVFGILDGVVTGKLDEVNRVLVVEKERDNHLFTALEKLRRSIHLFIKQI